MTGLEIVALVVVSLVLGLLLLWLIFSVIGMGE